MRKIIVPCICMMLVMTIMPLVASEETENEFEKNDLKFDVRHSIRLVRKDGGLSIPIYQSWNPLYQILFKYLDIVSFSIFEDTDDPEFLHAHMRIRDFRFSELRSCYYIYWMYDGTRCFAGTNTHTKGEYVASIAGYYDEDDTAHYSMINGEINEEDNILTWVIPKDLICNPESGDYLVEIHAATYLIYQKDCNAPIQLHLANDRAEPLLNECYSYTVQY